MKLIVLALIFINIAQLAYCQNIKTYEGVFDKGKATYQYYENEKFERIFQGKFAFTVASANGNKVNISGQFKNNKKDGFWSFTCVYPTKSSYNIEGNYSNGNMEGQWVVRYVQVVNKDKKKVVFELKTAFNDNVIVGNYTYKEPGSGKSLDFKFTDKGLIDSDYIFTFIDNGTQYEDKIKYKNGIMYWRLFRNMSNGEILEQFDNTKYVDSFTKQYDNVTNSAKVNSIYYRYLLKSDDIFFDENYDNRENKSDPFFKDYFKDNGLYTDERYYGMKHEVGQKYYHNLDIILNFWNCNSDDSTDTDIENNIVGDNSDNLVEDYEDNADNPKYTGFNSNLIFMLRRGSNLVVFKPERVIVVNPINISPEGLTTSPEGLVTTSSEGLVIVSESEIDGNGIQVTVKNTTEITCKKVNLQIIDYDVNGNMVGSPYSGFTVNDIPAGQAKVKTFFTEPGQGKTHKVQIESSKW